MPSLAHPTVDQSALHHPETDGLKKQMRNGAGY
ncbi:hypothetical protein BN8_03912 [Fibrisoma limi BUZ 3]|uniref:Uncharacterized protein n=1 Tax=Fibrisoma limi BUZ 3 TaxID=1185876 RepID=I2GLD7_9BACT|nr:hypothetical protein BN8_03912 [Fibrisoma limi BUZ 3]